MGNGRSHSCIWVGDVSYSDHNMIAGEVVEQLSEINFEERRPVLRVLTMSRGRVR